MSVIDDYANGDRRPERLSPATQAIDRIERAREILRLARERHYVVNARASVSTSVVKSVTDGYRDGEPPTREDLERAIVRLSVLVRETQEICTAVVAACDHAILPAGALAVIMAVYNDSCENGPYRVNRFKWRPFVAFRLWARR